MIARGWQQAEGALLALAGLAIGWVTLDSAGLDGARIGPWVWLMLIAPDLSMLFYLAGPRIGAAVYNLAHLYGLPLLLAVFGMVTGQPLLIAAGALWLAHIGADRALGYGLKSPTGFKDTHLGRIGRDG